MDFSHVFSTGLDLLQVVIGFTVIILLHELGHFVAARWAGIRVEAFAVGFGPAIFSYRKGLGLRRGSSEQEYRTLLATSTIPISPTEYRLNALPLGGYVKMLGQDDADPAARSTARDSYQNCPPWKRMIVISAGVVVNAITAAILFIIVFRVGLVAEAPVVGEVAPDFPAAKAVALNAKATGQTEAGLQRGDQIVSIDGDPIESFNDITLASLMASPAEPLHVTVKRPGVAEPLRFEITPKENPATHMLAMGFGPNTSTRIPSADIRAEAAAFNDIPKDLGLRSASVLEDVAGKPARSAEDLTQAAKASDGKPFAATFTSPRGDYTLTLTPLADLQPQVFTVVKPDKAPTQVFAAHLLGLVPTVSVRSVIDPSDPAKASGLKAGDIFARLGELEYPSAAEIKLEIARYAGKTIPVVVERRGSDGVVSLVALDHVHVSGGADPTIGFAMEYSGENSTALSPWPAPGAYTPLADESAATGKEAPTKGAKAKDTPAKEPPVATPSGGSLGLPAGARITAIGATPVSTFAQLRTALLAAARGHDEGVTVRVAYQPPVKDAAPASIDWALSAADIAALRKLSWSSPISPDYFLPEKVLLQRDSNLGAIERGLRETKNSMLITYKTYARLVQGTVRVENMKGPVGIAHIGTQVASRGFIWLLFFMAAISVNLAVFNFLPLPIVDGGHFVFLLYEQITGRPVSVAVQSFTTLVGLFAIGAIFLLVTWNDIRGLFGH